MNQGTQMIREFLSRRGWSQRKLAKEVGVSHVTIANILSGRTPRNETLISLRRIHGLGNLEPEHFVNGSDA